MKKLLFFLTAFLVLRIVLLADEISVDYQLMDRDLFEKVVVGNTIVGVTRQSHSLYMLYFLQNGYCELLKQNQIYQGSWWIEKDKLGRDVVRAFWPEYSSSEPKSLFSFENPRYGSATAIRYYMNAAGALFLAGKTFQVPVILVPGCAFASQLSFINKTN